MARGHTSKPVPLNGSIEDDRVEGLEEYDVCACVCFAKAEPVSGPGHVIGV